MATHSPASTTSADSPPSSPPLSGRRAQAARNDERILESAKAVFLADPDAPITAVAKHAGVGISALYTRYGSKEELLRRLCHDGLAVFVAETEAALGDDRDPWSVLRLHATARGRGHELDDPRPRGHLHADGGDVRSGRAGEPAA